MLDKCCIVFVVQITYVLILYPYYHYVHIFTQYRDILYIKGVYLFPFPLGVVLFRDFRCWNLVF